jgi:hypothetical protein
MVSATAEFQVLQCTTFATIKINNDMIKEGQRIVFTIK